MLVDCDARTNAGLPGRSWQFIAPEAAPDRLELNDEPYQHHARF